MENIAEKEVLLTEEPAAGEEEVKYTDEQLNDLIKKEKMKILGRLGASDLESAETTVKQVGRLKEQNEELSRKITEAENRSRVLARDIGPEYADFIIYEISGKDGDFSDNLDEYLAAHPQYRAQSGNWGMRQEAAVPVLGGVERAFYAMNPAMSKKGE